MSKKQNNPDIKNTWLFFAFSPMKSGRFSEKYINSGFSAQEFRLLFCALPSLFSSFPARAGKEEGGKAAGQKQKNKKSIKITDMEIYLRWRRSGGPPPGAHEK